MIGLIVARSQNNVIGKNGMIPWRIKGEQKQFKELTTGNIVIMGRKSYEEIGEYLGRSSAAIASKACSLKISKSPIRKKKPISLTKVFMTLSVLTNLGLISWIVYSLIR